MGGCHQAGSAPACWFTLGVLEKVILDFCFVILLSASASVPLMNTRAPPLRSIRESKGLEEAFGFEVISDLVKKRFSTIMGAEPKLDWIEG